MLAEVKKCADSNDIKGLHYIFVDCLDVDPTFDKYAADFEYCKSINGFLVPHTNMTPVKSKEGWDKAYWEQLKLDLMKNFSEERFLHMREVAKVIYADKIDRLQQERGKTTTTAVKVQEDIKQVETVNRPLNNEPIISEPVKSDVNEATRKVSVSVISDSEKQQQELLEKKRALELHNQQIEREQQAQRARIEAAKRTNSASQYNSTNTQAPKKLLGVAIAVLAVVAIIVVVVLIKVL